MEGIGSADRTATDRKYRMSTVEQFSKEVLANLHGQQDIGIQIPAGAFERARDLATLAEHQSMSASGCADLLVQLANLGFGTIHAEVNDFVRKDGQLVRVMAIDISEGCYFTSDGGLIGFDEVDEDNVFLESEVYDELGGRIPDAVETQAD